MTGELITHLSLGLVALLAMGLLVWQEYRHSRSTRELMDRLMARSLGEFAQVEKYRMNKPEVKKAPVELVDDYAATQAERANQLFSR